MADEKPTIEMPETPGFTVTVDAKDVVASSDALDALYKERVPDEAAPKTEDPPVVPKEDEAPPAVPKTEEAAPVVPKVEAAPVVATPKAEETPAAQETPKEEWEKVELPPYTKPNTAQAFAAVKIGAKTRIEALTKEREELSTKLQDAESKVGKVPAELEKELNELRDFRKKLDVDYDPSFKEFDQKVAQNDASILGKLKETGVVTEEAIDAIRKAGVNDVEWDNILDKLPSVARHFVQTKLVANEDLKDAKSRALDSARKNVDQFLEQREQAQETQAKEYGAQVSKEFQGLYAKLPWAQSKTAAANATAEEKAGAEAHNKFLASVSDAVKEIQSDDSPRMRAILITGYAQMLQEKRELKAVQAGLVSQQAAWATEKAALQKTLDEQKTFIDKIKKSSTSSLHSVIATGPVTKSTMSESGSDALDRLRGAITAD